MDDDIWVVVSGLAGEDIWRRIIFGWQFHLWAAVLFVQWGSWPLSLNEVYQGKARSPEYFTQLLTQPISKVVDSCMVEGAAYVGSWLFASRKMFVWGQPR